MRNFNVLLIIAVLIALASVSYSADETVSCEAIYNKCMRGGNDLKEGCDSFKALCAARKSSAMNCRAVAHDCKESPPNEEECLALVMAGMECEWDDNYEAGCNRSRDICMPDNGKIIGY